MTMLKGALLKNDLRDWRLPRAYQLMQRIHH